MQVSTKHSGIMHQRILYGGCPHFGQRGLGVNFAIGILDLLSERWKFQVVCEQLRIFFHPQFIELFLLSFELFVDSINFFPVSGTTSEVEFLFLVP